MRFHVVYLSKSHFHLSKFLVRRVLLHSKSSWRLCIRPSPLSCVLRCLPQVGSILFALLLVQRLLLLCGGVGNRRQYKPWRDLPSSNMHRLHYTPTPLAYFILFILLWNNLSVLLGTACVANRSGAVSNWSSATLSRSTAMLCPAAKAAFQRARHAQCHMW